MDTHDAGSRHPMRTDQDHTPRRWWRQPARTLVALGVLAGLVAVLAPAPLRAGDSLAEAARKEKERRAKLRKEGAAAATVTEDDLAKGQGSLASDPSAPVPEGLTTPASGDTRDAAAEGGGPDASREKQEAVWRGRAAKARARIEHARSEYDRYDRWIRFGQPAQTDGNGNVAIIPAPALKQMADEAQAEVAAAEAALEDLREEARRAGAPPGWLRE